ncbi:MAG TPA: DUF2799 domain-containing protein [Gammaproteobacteria bacterium]|nr:DUF2799 domain-containing protein [Gammaproteobacteria bacterium]
MRHILGFSLAVSLLMLTGCATMSEQACLATDWQSAGFEDGVAGRSVGSIGRYREACADYGIAPDLAAYRAGHSDGVAVYCRPGNGFEAGRRGYQYQGVCPADLEPDFLANYNDGRQLYELESSLRSVENQIAARHRRLEQLTQELTSASATIIANGTTPEVRAELLLDIAAMAKEQGEISEEIESLQAERALREADLYSYRQTLALAF